MMMTRVVSHILLLSIFCAVESSEGTSIALNTLVPSPSQLSTTTPKTSTPLLPPSLPQSPPPLPLLPPPILSQLPLPPLPSPIPSQLPPPLPPLPPLPPTNQSSVSGLTVTPSSSQPTPTITAGVVNAIDKWLIISRLEDNLRSVKKTNNQIMAKSTCSGRCGKQQRQRWTFENAPRCFCDEQCSSLKDCCYDYKQRCENKTLSYQSVEKVPSTCMFQVPKLKRLGFVLVNSCHLPSPMCNQFNENDVFASIPALDLNSNISYRNVFCAACSNSDRDIALWRVEARCRNDTLSNKSETGIMAFVGKQQCTVEVFPPQSFELVQHHSICVPRLNDKIYAAVNDSAKAQKLKELCDAYAFPVCSITPAGDARWFKNPHCLLYQGVLDLQDADASQCPNHAPPLPPLTIFFDFQSTTKYLISSKKKTEADPTQLVERTRTCKAGHGFDLFTRKCRVIFGPTSTLKNTSLHTSKLNCTLMKLTKGEFDLFENGSLFFRGEFRSNHSYIEINGSFYVCTNLTVNYTALGSRSSRGPSRSYHTLTVLTITGCIVSSISLLLIIFSYFILPDLRNLPGKIILSLASSMLIYLLLYFFINRSDRPIACLVIAIALHFFLLSMFFWMNVMAFDIHCTFTRKGRNLDRSQSRGSCCSALYLKYAMYSWLMPLLIVATSVGLDLGHVYQIGYVSGDYCFMNNADAKLYTVAIPVGLILLYNCVALCHTVLHIRKVQKQVVKVTNQSRKTGLPVICIKMTSVMGVTWILGYVASLQAFAFLWYPFVVLNSLQGFLIFISYVLNKRVLKMYRAYFKEVSGRRKTTISKRSTNIIPTSLTRADVPKTSVAHQQQSSGQL